MMLCILVQSIACLAESSLCCESINQSMAYLAVSAAACFSKTSIPCAISLAAPLFTLSPANK